MRSIFIEGKYDPIIQVLDEEKLIFKMHCLCEDFNFRKIHKIGEGIRIKMFDEPCKHLKDKINELIKEGYKIKVPVEMKGSFKLSNELSKNLMKRAKNMCENINCQNSVNLEVHRIIRGNEGGLYCDENCKVLCSSCHDLIHAGEFKENRI